MRRSCGGKDTKNGLRLIQPVELRPGKPKRYLLNSAGRPKFFSVVADVIANDYDSFTLSNATGGLRF